jgi:hypothetical protein
MFISVPILDEEGGITHKWIGIAHIAEVDFQDKKNVDAGIVINLRNNSLVYVEEPMYEFAPRLNKAWEQAVVVLLHNLQMELQSGTRKEPAKRKTTRVKK